MKYVVELSDRALSDIDAIIDYLSSRSTQGAVAWLEALHLAVDAIEKSPLQQPLAPEDSDHLETIRHYLFRTKRGRMYRALFIVRGQQVVVTHVRGAGQDRVVANDE